MAQVMYSMFGMISYCGVVTFPPSEVPEGLLFLPFTFRRPTTATSLATLTSFNLVTFG